MNFRPIFYLFCIFLSACTLLPFTSSSVEEKITSRVQTRWNALIEHNWSDAYQFETAGYRESHTLEQFKAKFGQAVSWQKVKVSKIELDDSKSNATVTVIVPFQMMLPGQGLEHSEAHLSETWLLVDGVWSHYTK